MTTEILIPKDVINVAHCCTNGEQTMEEIKLTNVQEDIYSIIETVIRSRQPVLISDKGKLLVKIVPFAHSEAESWLGCMRSTGKITGDIISPAEDIPTWDVLSQ